MADDSVRVALPAGHGLPPILYLRLWSTAMLLNFVALLSLIASVLAVVLKWVWLLLDRARSHVSKVLEASSRKKPPNILSRGITA
jgi:hypothetical protein